MINSITLFINNIYLLATQSIQYILLGNKFNWAQQYLLPVSRFRTAALVNNITLLKQQIKANGVDSSASESLFQMARERKRDEYIEITQIRITKNYFLIVPITLDSLILNAQLRAQGPKCHIYGKTGGGKTCNSYKRHIKASQAFNYCWGISMKECESPDFILFWFISDLNNAVTSVYSHRAHCFEFLLGLLIFAVQIAFRNFYIFLI